MSSDPADARSASPPTSNVQIGGQHRRRAAHLYGLIISGAVLATAPDDLGLARIALLLFGTLLVYWAAETYVHWIAARMVHRRDLTRHERRVVLADGLPLVTACAVPVLVLFVEAVLDVETDLAVRIALGINVALLVLVGWNMSTSGGLVGWHRVASTAATGGLGLAMIALKISLH